MRNIIYTLPPSEILALTQEEFAFVLGVEMLRRVLISSAPGDGENATLNAIAAELIDSSKMDWKRQLKFVMVARRVDEA